MYPDLKRREPASFPIKSARPNRTYGEGPRTPKEEGLVPNATLSPQVRGPAAGRSLGRIVVNC